MTSSRLFAAAAIVSALVAMACTNTSATVDGAEPAAALTTTIAPTTTTVAPTTSTTTSTTTTTTTTTSTTTTTTLPSALDIEGSPRIEFSIEVDPDLADQLREPDFVAFVIETLSDDRSWIGRGVGFALVEDGGLFTMTVATPDRVDELCFPLQTNGRFSCARNGWIAFNSDRWFGATESWPADLETYRRYLVNHEVGHYILGAGHPGCPGAGQPAPIMMQQTKGLDGCEANGWVDP